MSTPGKPGKKFSVVGEKASKNSKFGIGSTESKGVTTMDTSAILCCCIKLSNQCSSSCGGGGTANMTKEEIEL